MRRRDFVAGLAGATAWPSVARAQQGDRIRRIGVLVGRETNDPEATANLSELTRRLSELGWTDGRNVRMEFRWGAGSVDRIRTMAKELVGLQPDVILALGTPVTAALQQETRTVPIVFMGVSDPVGSSFVAGLARPDGNITGFINMEAGMAGKWLELLIEIAPSVKRVAIMFNPDIAPGGGSYYLPSFEAAARSLKVAPITAPIHSDTEIETVLALIGREPGGGLVLPPDTFTTTRRELIILLAARHNVPAVYSLPVFATDGGLLSYGADLTDIFRRSAPYVDRILRGAKPADLPVQVPTKFEMILNAKTARALGLTIPQ
jgi:putative tryptophan/tyrosine transport system substrate-binding protein